ncbi:hypothetical protein [Pseudofrankia inefficax]|uniref:Uncharacterized protein n=1 Tax=Pseudofrankia inefficax (strain DSM 45817 / CECT 9037 / DDB 130130 / EuI1c) TaxID=298654 RepID=E3J2R2_PSEI1|nr:hypothetical protein [Pseudofrankia inefficax]ADP81723.1 hypothetical protein FraEuI1c_3716 [Pseudofrankia inefficax]
MALPRMTLDRLRIERAVWAVDARLQDLPRRSRIARRRELRANLLDSAEDVGARQAVRQLGDLRVLAAGFLAAEYGELTPRPSWTATVATLFLVEAVMTLLEHTGRAAFDAGITTTTPRATGTFHWTGVPYLISDETFAYVNGTHTSVGGAWTPLVYVLMFAGAFVTGRMWRLIPARRRHQLSSAVTEEGASGGRS